MASLDQNEVRRRQKAQAERIIAERLQQIRQDAASDKRDPLTWRQVREDMQAEHRDWLLQLRQAGGCTLSREEIERRAYDYASESCRLAQRMAS